MRIISRLLILSFVAVALLIGFVVDLIFWGPLTPASPFFVVQRAAEQGYGLLVTSPVGRAQYALKLAERRVRNMGDLAYSNKELVALQNVDLALGRAIQLVKPLSPDQRSRLHRELINLVNQAEVKLLWLSITPEGFPEIFMRIETQLGELHALIDSPRLFASQLPQGTTGKGYDHSGIGNRACATCHEKNRPNQHAQVDCANCHQPGSWIPAQFNHAAAAAYDCAGCHLKDRPADHYEGKCSFCHNPGGWNQPRFNHLVTNAVDCISCHLKDRPSEHYEVQCSACHMPGAWLPANFDHTAANAVDCASCHQQDASADHYQLQCSTCHTPGAWRPVNFNHQAVGATDCISCHQKDAPADHYQLKCSTCHTSGAWLPVNFNHQAVGATDCIACHLSIRPANHFDGQCSLCHNTSSWPDATFNHSFPLNHGGANSVCSKCHPSGPPVWTCFTCHKRASTESKHKEEGIKDIASRCIACHPKGRGGD